MGKNPFKGAAISSMEYSYHTFVERKKREDNPAFYEKLARADQRVAAKADLYEASAREIEIQKRMQELDKAMQALKNELAKPTDVKYVRVGSSDYNTARASHKSNTQGMRPRIRVKGENVTYIPMVKNPFTGELERIQSWEINHYPAENIIWVPQVMNL